MARPHRTPGTTNAPGGKWHSTPPERRKNKPWRGTLTPAARAVLDALTAKLGPGNESAFVSRAIVALGEAEGLGGEIDRATPARD
jgi:hypothetical protein